MNDGLRTRRPCAHEDFEAHVNVGRIALTEDAQERDEIKAFVADITVKCALCGAPFGFRCQDVGLPADRPGVTPDALELHVPLISPTELELLGPLAAMTAQSGLTGYTIRSRNQ